MSSQQKDTQAGSTSAATRDPRQLEDEPGLIDEMVQLIREAESYDPRQSRRRFEEYSPMFAWWGRSYIFWLRGQWLTLNEWYDFLESDEELPTWFWLNWAQDERDGYAGCRDDLRAVWEDIEDSMDAFDFERPATPVPELIRKQCKSIVFGRRRFHDVKFTTVHPSQLIIG